MDYAKWFSAPLTGAWCIPIRLLHLQGGGEGAIWLPEARC